jgi:hypothetical protein
VELPSVELPSAEPPAAELPSVEPPVVELPVVELPLGELAPAELVEPGRGGPAPAAAAEQAVGRWEAAPALVGRAVAGSQGTPSVADRCQVEAVAPEVDAVPP